MFIHVLNVCVCASVFSPRVFCAVSLSLKSVVSHALQKYGSAPEHRSEEIIGTFFAVEERKDKHTVLCRSHPSQPRSLPATRNVPVRTTIPHRVLVLLRLFAKMVYRQWPGRRITADASIRKNKASSEIALSSGEEEGERCSANTQ